MRILWITNRPTPDIAEKIGRPVGIGVGWLNEPSKQLSQICTLGMAFPVSENYGYKEGHVNHIYYYAVPLKTGAIRPDETKIKFYEDIITRFSPDVIHIWGTEYVHSYLAVRASKNVGMLDKVVISIQGLVSVYARHFYGHIEGVRIKIPTLKNIYFKDSLIRQRRNFMIRGKYERQCISMVHHVIGRTDWDIACTTQINPKINYHFCNETLRNSFYENQWKMDECEKHSLFVSQCQYPLKGLHHALEALSILVKRWPDAHLYTTGSGRDILHGSIKERLFDSEYECYLRCQIKAYNLEKNITFLGPLDEEEMCERFCRTHVFLSPSSIENSSNSIGEAMIMGVPVVAADVGGIKNLMVHGEEGYIYQADAPYMLAYYVSKIFENDSLAEDLSKKGQAHARQIHDKERNLKALMDIYSEIML